MGSNTNIEDEDDDDDSWFFISGGLSLSVDRPTPEQYQREQEVRTILFKDGFDALKSPMFISPEDGIMAMNEHYMSMATCQYDECNEKHVQNTLDEFYQESLIED